MARGRSRGSSRGKSSNKGVKVDISTEYHGDIKFAISDLSDDQVIFMLFSEKY